MPDVGRTEREQKVVDDILAIPGMLGFVFPPLALGTAAVKLLVDLGFALYLANVREAVATRLREQSAGQAAARASVVTTALAHERNEPRICGEQLPGYMGRAYHGADCAAHAGCGKEIERC